LSGTENAQTSQEAEVLDTAEILANHREKIG
jgi:hypothetical protein